MSKTLIGNGFGCWKTIADPAAQLGDLERVDVLAVEQDPARSARRVGVSSVSRLSERSSVVLPQPDGPISASTSPWRTGSDDVVHRELAP